jgi:hypothetical protein
MVTLETPLVELMIQYSTHLSQRDLRRLALVSPWLCPIAQDVLYHSHMLEHLFVHILYHEKISHLLSFAHSLLRRPDLARKIRVLTIVTSGEDYSTSIQPHENSPIPDEYNTAFSFIRHVGRQSIQWRARIANWDARLKNGNGHGWAGLIGLWYLNVEDND